MVTLSGWVKLFSQQVIAAAHAADCSQLWFCHKHPQGAGSQVATCVQSDHDRILEFGREHAEKPENSAGRGEEGWRSMVKLIDDDVLQIWHCKKTSHTRSSNANSSRCDTLVISEAAVGILFRHYTAGLHYMAGLRTTTLTHI